MSMYQQFETLSFLGTSPFQSAYSSKIKLPITFPEVSPVTKQSFKDECDVNRIMARYEATGQLPNMNEVDPRYLDCSEMDFQEHMNFIAGAKSLFGELPASIRSKFENDPGKFLDFCSQEKNRPEMAEMGLLKPSDQWVVPPAPITPAPAPASEPAPAPAPAPDPAP